MNLRNSRSDRLVKWLLWAFYISTFLTPAWAAEPHIPSAKLNVRLENGISQRFLAEPAIAVKQLFPQGEARVEEDSAPSAWQFSLKPLLGNVRFVHVSDQPQHFMVAGVIYKERLYIFAELYWDQSREVMNDLMRATGTIVGSRRAARELAELYVSLFYFTLENPSKFVVSRFDELPRESIALPEESSDVLRDVISPPKVIGTRGGYRVEFFTTYPDFPNIDRWQFQLNVNGIQTAEDNVIFPDFSSREELYARAKKSASTSSHRRILFEPLLMGEGRSDDGAQIDLQVWAASDGPGISRDHYYYTYIPGGAEKKMHALLDDAISIVQEGDWRDESGKVLGKKALIIATIPETHYVSAEMLFQDQGSVLVVSCSSLRNLLEAVR